MQDYGRKFLRVLGGRGLRSQRNLTADFLPREFRRVPQSRIARTRSVGRTQGQRLSVDQGAEKQAPQTGTCFPLVVMY